MNSTATAAAWMVGNPERVATHLARYFLPHEDVAEDIRAGFSGRLFEHHLRRSTAERFTPLDVLAVEALSVDVPPLVAARLVDVREERFAGLLLSCRAALRDVADLRDVPDELIDGGPLVALHRELRDLPGLGTVVTSKLMAAKFPAHVPIRDRLVEEHLGLAKSRTWWAPIRELVSAGGVAETLLGAALPDGAPEVTLLRRLDVVLWMEERARRRDALHRP